MTDPRDDGKEPYPDDVEEGWPDDDEELPVYTGVANEDWKCSYPKDTD
ncbi:MULTISPECIES: hypothetical protein [Haloferax]|uniref:Uncharacterized protein n=1 Tax=Haloferax marinum TaxID=2666143 RepID=A0A6A8GA96_9EURY|nr:MULTISPECIES: hypothetical protein [Haloferax]MRW97193.1 hypothetical protein [Haloferax marinum]